MTATRRTSFTRFTAGSIDLSPNENARFISYHPSMPRAA
jgi:hypothetical protein